MARQPPDAERAWTWPTDRASLTRLLLADDWARLSEAGDRLPASAIGCEPATVHERIGIAFRDLLGAQGSALWLADETAPDTFTQVHGPTVADQRNQPLRAPRSAFGLEGKPGGPLSPVWLGEATSFSALRVPLQDRKGTVYLGAVVVARPPGRAFVEKDAALAALLAPRAVALIEQLRLLAGIRELVQEIQQASKFTTVLEIILRRAVRLVRADRGDILFHDWGQNKPIVCAWPESLRLVTWDDWSPTAPAGFIRLLWHDPNRDLLLVPDVHAPEARTQYLCCDPRTRAEMLIKLHQDGRQIAVLNVESCAPHGFDEEDTETLRAIVRSAADNFTLIGKDARLQKIVDNLAEQHLPPKDIARSILESVRAIYGFDRGIIYFPDYPARELRAYAMIGLAYWDLNAQPFTYRFEESAFATLVFRSGAEQWSPDPPNDPRVSQKGVEAFGIDQPMIGVPLLKKGQVIGVLVMWSKSAPPPTREHTQLLRPFAQLAALLLRDDQAEQRGRVFVQELEKSLKQMQTVLDLKTNLRVVMEGIRRLGLDRVRVFRFAYPGSMYGLWSLSSSVRGDLAFEELSYNGALDETAPEHFNPYIKALIDNLRGDHQEALIAQIYPTRELGPDPHAAKLGKPPDLEWVDVPLISAGKLYGALAADNLYSRRKITEEDREYLTAFAALAARAFAIEEKRGMLSAPSMFTLYQRISTEPERAGVVDCLLRYLNHGEPAPGFSRALFLARDGSGRCLTFQEGVGALGREQHVQATRRAQGKTLLDALEGSENERLGPALQGYSIGWQEDVVQSCVRRAQDEQAAAPFECPELRRRLHSDKALVAAPVSFQDKVLGLFVVDRQWQWRALGESDRAVLWSFAQEAGQLLHQHDLQRQLNEARDLANVGFLAQGLRHEITIPLSILALDAGSLVAARPQLPKSLAELVERVRQQIDNLSRTVQVLDAIGRGKARREPTDISALLAEVVADMKNKFHNSSIELRAEVLSPVPAVPVMPGMLRLALANLIENARFALDRQASGRIVIEAEVKQEALELRVRDNGPGMPVEILQQLRRFVSLTTRPKRGLGFGLVIVHRVALLHGGDFDIDSRAGQGTCATLTIPLHPPEVADVAATDRR